MDGPTPIAGLLRKSVEFADPEAGTGEDLFEMDANCEIMIFNSRSEAASYQLGCESQGWRGAWCLVDVFEKRTNL